MPKKHDKSQGADLGASPAGKPMRERKRRGKERQGGEEIRKGGAEKGFYASALSEAERILLPEALQVEGLDEEIAVLRMQLRSLMAETDPEDKEAIKLKIRSIETLLKAVSTKYRLSPKAEADLAQSIKGVLEGIGGALGLGEFDGTG